jgi:hypothetical protein
MRKTYLAGIVLVALGAVNAAQAGTTIDKTELLTAQNKYRSEVGLAPLTWSDSLAASAQQWAEQLATMNRMQHSGAIGKGENLAMWKAGRASLTQLVDLWGQEKHYFVHAQFPNVSTTGDWEAVGHYTQLIWKQTTDVGCGLATGNGNDFLVCQYQPKGNMFSEKVY